MVAKLKPDCLLKFCHPEINILLKLVSMCL